MVVNQVFPKGLDLSKFVGQWVVIYENSVIASNKDLTKLQKDIAKCERTPTIAKIPKHGTLIF